MHPALRSEVIKQLRRPIEPEQYRAIRQRWIDHSLAEDARDIPGLLATLTDDCLYGRQQRRKLAWQGRGNSVLRAVADRLPRHSL